VSPKSILFVNGSSDYLEVSINLGNAAKEIGIELGDEISFSF
jgi:S-adenosylmethionine hydrolase